jgi:hypothetical protein
LEAPGHTNVFGGTDTAPLEWFFPSGVTRGWNPSPSGGGRVINQTSRFRAVYAARPADLAFRPDGRRAIVGFHQTGNFGILDLDTQRLFATNPPAAPAPYQLYSDPLRAPPSSLFHDFVAVTPSLEFDGHIWPDRGRLLAAADVGSGLVEVHIPSPDERLLFVHDVEYAQSGRFAVATHSGSGSPKLARARALDWRVSWGLPIRVALQQLGFVLDDAAGTAIRQPSGPNDDDSLIASPGTALEFERGGGALTILDDRRIGAELAANAMRTINVGSDSDPLLRAYYATQPLRGADQQITEYQTAAGLQRFWRPRGVAIQPLVSFEAPHFGDHVAATAAVHIVSGSVHARSILVRLFDLDDRIPDPADLRGFELVPRQVGERRFALPVVTQGQRFVKPELEKLFAAITQPVPGHRYRIEAHLLGDPGATAPDGELIAMTDLELVVDSAPIEPPPAALSCAAKGVTISLENIAPNPGGRSPSAGERDPDEPRTLAPMVFGGRSTLRYTIEPPDGRVIDPAFGVRLRLADGAQLVEVNPARRTGAQGDFTLEIERPTPLPDGRSYAAREFEVVLDYGFDGCLEDLGGLQETRAKIPVVSNWKAFIDRLTPDFVDDGITSDGCTVTFGGLTTTVDVVRAAADLLGFDPLACPFPPLVPGAATRDCQGTLPDSDAVIAVDLASPGSGQSPSVIELTDTTTQISIQREQTGGGVETFVQRSILSRSGAATDLQRLSLQDLANLTVACPTPAGQPPAPVVEIVQLRDFFLQLEFRVLQAPGS